MDAINHRALAMLRAVGGGRAQLTCSSEPDLFIDGLSCGDQFTAHLLAHQGFIRPRHPGATGQRVQATLSPEGRAAIAASAQLPLAS
ncbi:MAG: hypothetical protein ACRDQ7_01355 [Haloechinothrix sp.]